MEWTDMSKEERSLACAIMAVLVLADYPAKRAPDLLRALATQFDKDIAMSDAKGICHCATCQSERAARAAANN